MIKEQRRCIAAIAAALINHIRPNAVYDYDNHKYTQFMIDINGKNISFYDYERRSYITGILPNLYDYGTKKYVQLLFSGTYFNGFDFSTGTYFNGSVNGREVSFFDYEDSRYHNYGV